MRLIRSLAVLLVTLMSAAGAAFAAPDIALSTPFGAQPNGSQYTFPPVQQGVAQSVRFTITNTGNNTLTLSNVFISGDPFYIIESPSMSIAPGASTGVRVRTLSNVPGNYSGYLEITSNDPDESPYQVQLWVQILGPYIEVARNWDGQEQPNGSTFDEFPYVAKNQATSRRFQIKNAGTTALSVSVSVSGEGFSLIESPPATIQPGTIGYFRVRLLSATAGHKTGAVTITNNDPFANPYVIYLEGDVLNSIFLP